MQKKIIDEMEKLRLLLDKKGIFHTDTVRSFYNTIYENITFIKGGIKFTVSRREHHKINGVLLYELIRVDKVSSHAEEYGYFKQIYNLPILSNYQKKDLVSFNGNYEVNFDKDYLTSLRILF
jgi:hypothetical protein